MVKGIGARGGSAAGHPQAVAVEVPLSELRAARLDKVAAMRAAGVNPFAYNFSPTHSAATFAEEFQHLAAGSEDPSSATVALAGRVMTRRSFGKLMFLTVQDESGTFQLYVDKGRLGEARFGELKAWTDAGDIVGAKGGVRRTDKGELSVVITEWAMLTKALLPLPDKFKGFTDVGKRYRQRHVDLIVNPEVRKENM